MLIFGSIEFGLAIQVRTAVQNAAREGVRMASLVGGSDGSAALKEIQDRASLPLDGMPGVVVNPPVVTCTPAPCVIGSAKQGSVATVTVTVQYAGITGFLPVSTVTSTSTMRIE
jgi:Flp pilus assembly protein TadG